MRFCNGDFFFFFCWIIKNLLPKRPMAKQTICSRTSLNGYQRRQQTDGTSPKHGKRGISPIHNHQNQTPQTGRPSITTSIPAKANLSPHPGQESKSNPPTIRARQPRKTKETRIQGYTTCTTKIRKTKIHRKLRENPADQPILKRAQVVDTRTKH